MRWRREWLERGIENGGCREGGGGRDERIKEEKREGNTPSKAVSLKNTHSYCLHFGQRSRRDCIAATTSQTSLLRARKANAALAFVVEFWGFVEDGGREREETRWWERVYGETEGRTRSRGGEKGEMRKKGGGAESTDGDRWGGRGL
jgi:hypothetical protein